MTFYEIYTNDFLIRIWTWLINISKAISWHFLTLIQRIGSAIWKVLFYEKEQAACGSERLVQLTQFLTKPTLLHLCINPFDSNHIKINLSSSLTIKRAVTKLLELLSFSPRLFDQKIPSTIELISSLTFSWKCQIASTLFFLILWFPDLFSW